MSPKIINLILLVDFKTPLDLSTLADRLDESYDFQLPGTRFPAGVLRMKTMSVLIFSSGKCICSGINEKKVTLLDNDGNLLIDRIVNDLAEIINKAFDTPIVPDYKIVNIVTILDLKEPVDLDIVLATRRGCVYEPDIFPALIMRTKDPHHTFLIFSTGKVIAHLPHPSFEDDQKIGDLIDVMSAALQNALSS